MAESWFDRLLQRQALPTIERPPAAPARDGTVPPMLAQFDSPLDWMRKAWGLTSGKCPRCMDFWMLRLTTDPSQGGWPFMQLASFNITSPANSTAGQFLLLGLAGAPSNAGPTLAPINSVWAGFAAAPSIAAGGAQIPIDPALAWRILGFSVTHIGGAAAGVVQIVGAPNRTRIFPIGGTNAFPILAAASIVNGGGVATMSPVAGAPAATLGLGLLAPLWVPPPHDWQVSLPPPPGGGGDTGSGLLSRLPARVG